MHAERSSRQEYESLVVSRRRVSWRDGANMEDAFRARGDPDPLRTHPEPLRDAASRQHLRLSP
jgi:hypothetical protein